MVVAAPLSSQRYILSFLCCIVGCVGSVHYLLNVTYYLFSVVLSRVLVALSPHPPVTMSPLQLVSKRPTHDSVVPLNIHWGMRASVEEEQVFQSSLYKDAPE